MTHAPDLESRAAPDDHHALRLWLRMLTCCNLIEGEIRNRLRSEFDTTLPRFDLMAQLQRAPEGMKMVSSLQIRPGMPVDLFVKTGERTMMNYLLKPVFDQVKMAMTEE